jgi:membrane-associated HD superfamily phosphohydrolase|tara:strand:- start:40 stop:501 length:462 start_codon:yes stop_codon:yes gene_type:complete
MKTKRVGITIALWLFAIVTALDFYTTNLLGELVQYLEANPIYKYTGIAGIVIINIILGMFMWYIYTKSRKVNSRFITMNVLVTIIIIKVLVAWSNWQVYKAKPTLQAAMAVTTEMKQQTIIKFGAIMFLPYIIAMITYYLFIVDHNIDYKMVD